MRKLAERINYLLKRMRFCVPSRKYRLFNFLEPCTVFLGPGSPDIPQIRSSAASWSLAMVALMQEEIETLGDTATPHDVHGSKRHGQGAMGVSRRVIGWLCKQRQCYRIVDIYLER